MEDINKKEKTYKREIACVLLIYLGYLVETKDVEVIELLVWPIFTFTALAFGMQWASPNGGLLLGKSSRSSGG